MASATIYAIMYRYMGTKGQKFATPEQHLRKQLLKMYKYNLKCFVNKYEYKSR